MVWFLFFKIKIAITFISKYMGGHRCHSICVESESVSIIHVDLYLG